MPRPNIAIPRRQLLRLYDERGLSLHECARRLGVARRVIRERLQDAGVPLRDHDEAVELSRYLSHDDERTCLWPACPGPWPLCDQHDKPINQARARGRCAHPECAESGSDGWCYLHGKRAAGLLDTSEVLFR